MANKVQKPKKLKLLVVAAHSSELACFVKMGRKYLVVQDGIAFLSAGVGPVAATFGLTHFLEDYRPEKIIAIGTAGIINETKFKIGEVVQAQSITTASGLDFVYTPKLQPQHLKIQSKIKIAKPARIYCPQEITRDESIQKDLVLAKHDVEHLEAFAFAFVAKKFRIPIEIVLGLTNTIGKKAHEQWIKNADSALKATSDSVTNKIL